MQVGEILAQALIDGSFIGRRPTTLVGFSLGARVIFYCLKVENASTKFYFSSSSFAFASGPFTLAAVAYYTLDCAESSAVSKHVTLTAALSTRG